MGEVERSRDFVEALSRGIDVLCAFGPTSMAMTVSEVAARTGLARPTARRLLITLEELGYARSADGVYSLTARTLELGASYISALGMWDVARPHMEELVAATRESSSMAQLDGSDIVYVARVAVPKIIALVVTIGTRFPAVATSMGRVLLADLDSDELDRVLALGSESGVVPRVDPARADLDQVLAEVRQQGFAVSDEQLSVGIRSVAAPVRDASGAVVAALNVTVHAAETSMDTLLGQYLPRLMAASAAITEEWSYVQQLPVVRPGAAQRPNTSTQR
ncbi:MAG: IclR family transcriptional regulator domain-containing protein [Ilumatobacteraceae bacterium]